jgi:TPR repeat protein
MCGHRGSWRGGWVWPALIILVLLIAPAAARAACSRACPVAQRDEHGCCPARASGTTARPRLSRPAPAIKLGKLPSQCRDYATCAFVCGEGADAAACVRAGNLAWFGLGDHHRADAAKSYRRACTDQLTLGCAGLGEAVARGLGEAADPKQAARWLATACKAGDGRGCMALAALQLAGKVAPGKGEPRRLLTRAQTLLARACKTNVDLACLELIELHGLHSGLLPDARRLKAAVRHGASYAAARCAEGYRDGCVTRWRFGAGLDGSDEPPLAGAVAELGQLCDQGYGAACGGVIDAIMRGRLDLATASLLDPISRKGCGMGDPASCFYWAMHGLTGPAKTQQRRDQLSLACEHGLGAGCTMIASELRRAGDPAGQARYLDRACQVEPAICRGAVAAPHPAHVELTTSGCTVPGLGQPHVIGGAQVAISDASVGSSVTVILDQIEPRMTVSSPAWIAGRVRLIIMTTTGIYMNLSSSTPDPVHGTLVVHRYQPDTGYLDVELEAVTLQDERSGQLCVVSGHVVTSGRDF